MRFSSFFICQYYMRHKIMQKFSLPCLKGRLNLRPLPKGERAARMRGEGIIVGGGRL